MQFCSINKCHDVLRDIKDPHCLDIAGFYMLCKMGFYEKDNIFHGDIKPSNIFLI